VLQIARLSPEIGTDRHVTKSSEM